MVSELLKKTEVWKVSDEDQAVQMIAEYKDNAPSGGYTITKSGYKIKTRKQKGEIVDYWAEVELTFSYGD